MDVNELARVTRSVRRFVEDEPVGRGMLEGIIDAARLAPCAANLQELRFVIIDDEERRSRLHPLLRWAGYLKAWDGPAPGERPPAFVLILCPVEEKPFTRIDAGIAAAYMCLAARAAGLGACILMSFDRGGASEVASAPPGLSPLLAVALGRPAERVVIEDAGSGGIEYWRDEDGLHHVPKRSLEDLVLP